MPNQRDKQPLDQVKITRRQAENVRKTIQVSKIVERLQKAAKGELEMTPTQLQAGKVLLDKTLPSLTATTISEEVPPEVLMSHDEIVESLKKRLEQMPDVKRQMMDWLLPPAKVLEHEDTQQEDTAGFEQTARGGDV